MVNIRGYMDQTNHSKLSFSIANASRFSNETVNDISMHPIGGNSTVSYKYNIPVEVVVTLFSIIFIVDLIGNSIVVLIVVKKRRMQTFTNWLILNLAIADLSVALICIPLEIPLEINGGRWIYGKSFCSVFYPIQTSTIYGSVLTLVALSFSRYWAIIHPFRRQPTVHLAKTLLGVIWVCSIVVVVPYMTVLKYEDGWCIEKWTMSQRRTYTIALFTFQFLLPIFFIAIAYVSIIHELSFKKEKKGTMKVDKAKQKETKKVVKLLLIITVTFAVCVLPYNIMALLNEFGAANFTYYNDINLASYILLYLNSALNPIIYNVFNESFRESFAELYKTVIAFFTNRTHDLDENFFSGRRASMYPDAQNWHRFSLTQSVGTRSSLISQGGNRISLTSEGSKTSTSLLSAGSVYLSPNMTSYVPPARYFDTSCTKCTTGQDSGNSSPVFL